MKPVYYVYMLIGAVLGLAAALSINHTPARADGSKWEEHDTEWAHCLLVKDGGYSGNSPALSCVPKEK
jgi:hypothetical protein